ncbi:MAG: hypothetical protein IPM82_23245 [Saprospiraceae bacterium]|nr:hypothetical protein [Saprospiraceae bacterium]
MKNTSCSIHLLLLSSICFGQKIKVKNNIVCADKKPVLRIEKANGRRPDFTPEKVILSNDNDTLVWFSKNRAYLSKANYESEERMITYYSFEIKGTGILLNYANGAA